MLISTEDFEAIKSGRIDTAFRRWIKPTVKTGGTLTTAAGVLAIDAVDVIALDAVEDADLKRAGFADRPALDAFVADRKGTLYRIRLRYVGPDPRLALRDSADLSDAEAETIGQALSRMDGGTPWTQRTLQLIADNPGRLAAELADLLGLEKLKFKGNVRRLKALGLTESLEVGYRLSPRGQAWLARPTASA